MRFILLFCSFFLPLLAYTDMPRPRLDGTWGKEPLKHKTPYPYDSLDLFNIKKIKLKKKQITQDHPLYIQLNKFFVEDIINSRQKKLEKLYYRKIVEEFELTDDERTTIKKWPFYFNQDRSADKHLEVHEIITLGSRKYNGAFMKFLDKADIDGNGSDDYIMRYRPPVTHRYDSEIIIFDHIGNPIWRWSSRKQERWNDSESTKIDSYYEFTYCIAKDYDGDSDIDLIIKQEEPFKNSNPPLIVIFENTLIN
ncbi:MAG: hypothetical protein GY756_26255 [bacterium]|nr:hypothetical protein [bacterium]